VSANDGGARHADVIPIVPFYFAAPRRGGGRTQGGSGDTSYQRTAPSSLIIVAFGTVSMLFQLLVFYSQWTAAAILHRMKNPTTYRQFRTEDDDVEPPTLKADKSLPIFYPDVIIAYNTRPPPNDQERLDAWNVEAEKISTVKKEVYIVRNPTLQMLEQMTEFSGLQSHIRPTNTAISIHSIIPMLEFIGKVSIVLLMLQGIAHEQVTMDVFDGFTHHAPEDIAMAVEEGEVAQGGGGGTISLHNTMVDYSVGCTESITSLPWGKVETLLGRTPSGIFCPFELNYAAPDPNIGARFIQRFAWLFCDQNNSDLDSLDIEAYQTMWATELSNCLGGHHLAHIMMCCIVAADTGSSVFALQLPERHYEGSVLVKRAGSLTIRGAGLESVTSVDNATLTAELQTFGFHTVILRQILDLVGGAAITTESVTSMRHLREIVFMGTGMPDGTTRNKISRLLPKLSFGEKPLGVNESSIDQIMQLLAHPDMLIPRSLFLATSSFFVDDIERFQLILAAWGDKPPTFNYGGTVLMATAVKGKGVPTGVKDHDSAPPRILQMKRVDMSTAVTGWNTLMARGYIWGLYDRKVDQGRAFSGSEKTRVWQIIGKWAGVSVVPKGTVEQPPQAGGSGQKRVGGDEGSTESRATKKKRGLF
jgi:hypothetical protein